MEKLDQPFLLFPSEHGFDAISWRDILEGTLITGAMGSGKTSGSGKAYRTKLLQSGAGGLVLCAKTSEAGMWIAEAKKAGRESDVVVIGKDSPYRFRVLDYEARRKETENVVRLIDIAMEMTGKRGTSQEPFWQDAQRMVSRAAVDMLRLSGDEISFGNIARLIQSAPESGEDMEDPDWKEGSFFFKVYQRLFAAYDDLSALEQQSFRTTMAYWFKRHPNLDERTRANVIIGIDAMLDGFQRGVIFEVLSDEGPEITPEETFKGKILIVDLSPAEYGHTGTIAQGIIKYVWQRAVLRRQKPQVPTWCYVDEAHLFVNSFDQEFQSTAREYMCATVYLTQNFSGLLARLNTRAVADSLVGCFSIKIGHANGDAVTNEWFSRAVGFEFKEMSSWNAQDEKAGAGGSQARHYRLDPSEFLMLEMGAERYDYEVGAYIFKPGIVFNETGKPFRHILFSQGA